MAETAGAVFRERFAATLVEVGMPRMPSRVFAALFAEDSGRLTAAELADTLQVSPAAISGAVRYLGQVGMASREREPGSRRDVFVVHDDVLVNMMGRRDQLLHRLQDTVREGATRLPPGPAATRAARSADFLDFLQAELPKIIARWREEQVAAPDPFARSRHRRKA